MSFARMMAVNLCDAATRYGYDTLACFDAITEIGPKSLVVRVDVDFSPRGALEIAEVLREWGLEASFFWRVHSGTYSLSDAGPYIRWIEEMGFEIGLHHEAITQEFLCGKPADVIMREDLAALRRVATVVGVSSHGTFFRQWNNLDFWKWHDQEDFRVVYEAYDLMEKTWYVSDSGPLNWKVYECGVLRPDDHRSPQRLMRDGVDPVYAVIHPCVYD